MLTSTHLHHLCIQIKFLPFKGDTNTRSKVTSKFVSVRRNTILIHLSLKMNWYGNIFHLRVNSSVLQRLLENKIMSRFKNCGLEAGIIRIFEFSFLKNTNTLKLLNKSSDVSIEHVFHSNFISNKYNVAMDL